MGASRVPDPPGEHQINYALFFEECAGFEIMLSSNPADDAEPEYQETDQHTLGREVGIDRTNVADVLRRLEQRGLLTRRKGEVDRRAVLARLTPTGEKVTREMFKSMQRAQARLLEPLPPKERAVPMARPSRLVDANNHLGRTVFQPS